MEPVRLLGVYAGSETVVTYPNGHQAAYVNTVFDCEIRGGALRRFTDETVDAAFVGAAELDDYRMTPWAKALLPRMYKPEARSYFQRPSWRPPL